MRAAGVIGEAGAGRRARGGSSPCCRQLRHCSRRAGLRRRRARHHPDRPGLRTGWSPRACPVREGDVDLARRWDRELPGPRRSRQATASRCRRAREPRSRWRCSSRASATRCMVLRQRQHRSSAGATSATRCSTPPRPREMVTVPAALLHADRPNELARGRHHPAPSAWGGLSVVRYGPVSAIEPIYGTTSVRWRHRHAGLRGRTGRHGRVSRACCGGASATLLRVVQPGRAARRACASSTGSGPTCPCPGPCGAPSRPICYIGAHRADVPLRPGRARGRARVAWAAPIDAAMRRGRRCARRPRRSRCACRCS